MSKGEKCEYGGDNVVFNNELFQKRVMMMDIEQHKNCEKTIDNIYSIQHSLTMKVNNEIEDFVIRAVNEYGNSEGVTVNAKKLFEAVKKQMPMQIWGNKYNPVHIGYTVNGLCPICNTEFVCVTPKLYKEKGFGYCKQCGQKLAWDKPKTIQLIP